MLMIRDLSRWEERETRVQLDLAPPFSCAKRPTDCHAQKGGVLDKSNRAGSLAG